MSQQHPVRGMNMKVWAARAIGIYLALMLALTFLSWKLDGLRMPLVLCVEPIRAALADEYGGQRVYTCVLPLDVLRQDGDEWYVYQVDDTASAFTPLMAKRKPVVILAATQNQAAVRGVYGSSPRIVRYASRPLYGESVSVTLAEEAAG